MSVALGVGIGGRLNMSAAIAQLGGAVVDPYPDFPSGINLVDAWLANLTYMFQDETCTTPVTAAAQAVKGWLGRNGNIFAQPTTGNAPVADLSSSIWSLSFVAASSHYMLATLAVSQPITIYTVAFQDNAAGSSYQFDGVGAGARNACIISVTGFPMIFAGSGPVGPPGAMPASPYAWAFKFAGAASSIRSSAGDTGAIDAGTNGVAGYTLGSRFNQTQFFNKRIRAFLVCNAAHDTTTQDAVLAWLRTNFGAN